MDVVVADPGAFAFRGVGGGAAVGLPPAAVRDPSDLLDVDVDQLAGTLAFVADRSAATRSDHRAGERVAVAQVWHVVEAQDPARGPGREPELGSEPVLSAPVFAPGRDHGGLHRGWSAGWAGVRS
ncbi:hypothetical protein ASD90_21655 [Terrabacter sp. Root181]|nr:hypothetical protein ASD90_21655 [Terrabacter sp. Root181]